MASPEVHQLFIGQPITCHAFNKDRTQVAVSPNNHVVEIYEKVAGSWALKHTLDEHDRLVTGIDWAPETNRIVTCSQDRNAYVWEWNAAQRKWVPTLVLLRINRAATCVKWSPKENKFAVASGARLISVGYFEAENNWWICKHLKKPLRSTVLSLDWHPDNILLIAGSADMQARVFSAYIKGVDKTTSYPVWGEKFPFNTVCGEFPAPSGGWVHSVAFAPSGNRIAWAAHDSTISIADGLNAPQTVTTGNLPIVSLIFASETSIIGVGHDCVPYLFALRGGQWVLVEKLDQGQKKAVGGNTAMRMFQQMDSRAQQTGSGGVELNSIHQNTITCVRPYATSGENVTQFSTTGVDGKLVIWKLSGPVSA
ncbi:WD40-repeat-containing domain protein [Gaertneriomyces semiglobifer]|nr:WD40-repeat-containing domain protein [Gaertneriomyces semiglobifer]